MESTNNKRLQALRNSGAEKIFDAYNWVIEHQNEFKEEVYGPVLVEVSHVYRDIDCCIFRIKYIWHCILLMWLGLPFQVNVSNRFHADYLEGHVPYYIWKVLNNLYFCYHSCSYF